MAEDARAIANVFLDFACLERLEVSHLSLQKILFFAHAWHLAKYDAPLVGQKFEAWRYGPVVRVVFDQLKAFGRSAITRKLTKLDVSSGGQQIAECILDEEKLNFLKHIFRYYSRFHSGRLVELTHVQGGPWDTVWNKAVDKAVPGMLISDDEIKMWILREGGRGREWFN